MNWLKTKCIKMAVFFATISFAQATHAMVVTFDDLNPYPGGVELYWQGYVPNVYSGLNWTNAYFFDNLPTLAWVDLITYERIPFDGRYFGQVSPSIVALNAGGGGSMLVSSGSAFNFNGVYLTGAYRNGLNITVNGYNGSSLLYSTTVTVNSTTPSWFNFNYLGIDSVSFASYGGVSGGYSADTTTFIMDNFTYSPVPVPASLWLFGSGLLGLIGLGWRHRSA